MSATKSFFKGNAYIAEDEASDINASQPMKPSRRPFLNSTETSSKMEVSPEMEDKIFHPFERKRKKFFQTETTPSSERKRSFLSYTADDNLFDNDSSDNGSENDSSKRTFFKGNLNWQEEETSCDTPERPPLKDPVEEALALLSEMTDNDQTSQEVSKLIKAAAEQLHSDAKPANDADNASESTISVNETRKDSAKKENSATKNKEPFSAASVKDQILKKVPFIKHTGGLYAYNGRTYVAINMSSQLVGIVINQVYLPCFRKTTV